MASPSGTPARRDEAGPEPTAASRPGRRGRDLGHDPGASPVDRRTNVLPRGLVSGRAARGRSTGAVPFGPLVALLAAAAAFFLLALLAELLPLLGGEALARPLLGGEQPGPGVERA